MSDFFFVYSADLFSHKLTNNIIEREVNYAGFKNYNLYIGTYRCY